MRNPEQTIGNLIDKSSLTIISYTDNEGFPISKAMLSPREREGIKTFWFSTNTSSNKVKYFKENPKAKNSNLRLSNVNSKFLKELEVKIYEEFGQAERIQ